jgi:hypothetical protein
MTEIKIHYFPADDSRVITGQEPDGRFAACDGRAVGRGRTRLEALADLAEKACLFE